MQKNLYFTKENSEKKLNSWKAKLNEVDSHWREFDSGKTALLVIDMQKYFLDENCESFIPTSESIIPNVKELVDMFRGKDLPVIFTHFAVKEGEKDTIKNWWGRSVKYGDKESEIIEEIEPKKDEKIIRKSGYSSFLGTSLDTYLKENNIENVVITGVLTNLCCETAAREAFNLGYNVYFVMDGTTTYEEEMHMATLLNISYGFATPISTDDILNS